MSLVSPTFGIITKITNNIIHIYIRGYNDEKEDNHNIFSPITGEIKKTFEKIKLKRKGEYTNNDILYIFDENKKGRLNMKIKNINFSVEVGKGYITNSIRLSNKKKFKKGEKIGEIIIGSYSFIKIPKNYIINVNLNDELIGGKTIIATKIKKVKNKKNLTKKKKK